LINFVSNLPSDLRTGGFSAMNAAAYEALRKLDTVHYVGPINPPTIFQQRAVSKLLRTLGVQGSFFAFSRERLGAVAEEVHQRRATAARFDFFHGFTPWILTRPPRLYAAWSDCTFHDYIEIYHRRGLFRPADLERIEHTEAVWLRGARYIGFSNGWAAQRAISHYALDASRVHVVGNFGEIEMPAADEYAGAKQFAFVSTDFDAKGGPTVLAAFRKLRQRHADACLVIVGAAPPGGAIEPGVIVTGYLRKEVPDEYARFRTILAATRALVHPTNSDISPLIVIEAGYFGCPAIASKRFAIPELVDHGISGILLDDVSVNSVADAMSWMLDNETLYQDMRRRARTKATSQHSKVTFESNMHALVAPLMAHDENPVSR
jgi:glycosyltransferase involved in cell wall biosynthesis